MKMHLNCWIVALWIWARAHARCAIWTRRSTHFRGWVNHAGTMQHVKGRTFVSRDYLPPLNDLWTRRNIGILFIGTHRVVIFKAVKTKRFKTDAAARAFIDSLKT